MLSIIRNPAAFNGEDLCASLGTMYTRFFGLHHVPFSIAPDPRYLFMSERHREALAHLLYGQNGGGGFVLLTGEIGAGKTTVCRLFLEQVPAHCKVAYIFNPKQTVVELLQSVCDEFGVTVPRPVDGVITVKNFIDPLNRFLLDSHADQQNTILIIDEAQNLSADVLEQLRLLTNLETNERKLLQIILIGQPELRTMLGQPGLEQLAQRVIARFHLGALSVDETAQYIAHRLAVAGFERVSPFNASAMRRIHQLARGIPRRINLLCDRALLGAYAGGKLAVDARMIESAATEVFDLRHSRAMAKGRWRRQVVTGLSIAVLAIAIAGAAMQRGLPGTWLAMAPGSLDSRPPDATPTQARLIASNRVASKPPEPLLATQSLNRPAASSEITGVVNTAGTPPFGAAGTMTAAGPITANGKDAAGVLGAEARDLSLAFHHLAKFWQLTLNQSEADPCRAAQLRNVYCFTVKYGLAEIEQLDRPGILTLHDDDDQKYYAVLLGLNHQAVTLRIGERTETVSLSALAQRWRGGFSTLWRGPPGYQSRIAKGDAGILVDWLSRHLAIANGTQAAPSGGSVDLALSAQIRQFQIAHGLKPDGVAGTQTMMRLALVAGETEPHLTPGATIPIPAVQARK